MAASTCGEDGGLDSGVCGEHGGGEPGGGGSGGKSHVVGTAGSGMVDDGRASVWPSAGALDDDEGGSAAGAETCG